MNVELVKLVDGRRRVLADVMFVGEIECVHPGHDIKDSWYDYRGVLRFGPRWLPTLTLGSTRRTRRRRGTAAGDSGLRPLAAFEALYRRAA